MISMITILSPRSLRKIQHAPALLEFVFVQVANKLAGKQTVQRLHVFIMMYQPCRLKPGQWQMQF